MKKKKLKKLLAITLCVMMVTDTISFFPQNVLKVYAEETVLNIMVRQSRQSGVA